MKLELTQIKAEEVSVKSNLSVKPGTFSLNPRFSRRAAKNNVDPAMRLLVLSMEIEPNAATPLPFTMKVVLQGFFRVTEAEDDNAERDFLRLATAALLPHLQQSVSLALAASHQPPILLPAPADGILFPEDRDPAAPTPSAVLS